MEPLKQLRPNGVITPKGRAQGVRVLRQLPVGRGRPGDQRGGLVQAVRRQIPVGGRPGDERGFLHKKILGAIGTVAGFIPGPVGGVVSTVAKTLAGGGRTPARAIVPVELAPRTSLVSAAVKEVGKAAKGFGNGSLKNGRTECPRGMRPDFLSGQCEPAAGQEVGEALMGRYGAALVPGSRIIDRAVCLRGMQLGDDGLCYNKSQISNKQRMWPRGRRPLLTGGDMRAIAIAARAGKRVEATTKRLRSMGMIKALPKGRGRRALPAGHQATLTH